MKKNVFFLSLISILSLSSCGKVSFDVKKTYFAFDTVFSYQMSSNEYNDVIGKDISDIINEFNVLFDNYNIYSDKNNISTINNTNEEVKIDRKLYDALYQLDEYQKISKGYFNPFLGKLTSLWKDSLHDGVLPNQNEIDLYLLESKSTSLEFNEHNLTVKRKGNGHIDLGGYAKGYVVSYIDSYLNEHGIKKGLFNAGSSTILLKEKPDNTLFTVGLKYLPNKYLELNNTSISTSAIYEQQYFIGGKSYSHIVNPFDGNSSSKYDFITVIHQDSTLGDALSTAFMNMELDVIKEIEKEFELKVIVSSNHTILYCSEKLDIRNK